MVARPALRLWIPLCLAVLGQSRVAAADPGPDFRIALEYRVDPALRDCPTRAELASRIAEQLGYDPVQPEAAYRLSIAIAPAGDVAEARLEWTDPSHGSEGERKLRSETGDCSELSRSLAFAAVVQIQLHAPPSVASGAPAKPAPPPPPPKAPPPANSPPAVRRSARIVAAGAGVLVRHGATPGFSAGLRVFGAVGRGPWWVELGALGTAPSELTQSDGSGFSARELGGSLAPCLRASSIAVCALGYLGVLHVRGEGVDRVGSPSSPLGGVGARLQLSWPSLERVGVSLTGDAIMLVTPRDVLLNQAVAWSTSPLAFTVSADFAAIFR